MTSAHQKIGMRVTIVDVLHSHSRARTYRDQLLGRQGVIVAVLREGLLALVKLDDDTEKYPGGVRRWALCWDDLALEEDEDHVDDVLEAGYRAGFVWSGRHAVQHAVLPGTEVSLCGRSVCALPICGWSLTFSPGSSRACPLCVNLTGVSRPRLFSRAAPSAGGHPPTTESRQPVPHVPHKPDNNCYDDCNLAAEQRR